MEIPVDVTKARTARGQLIDAMGKVNALAKQGKITELERLDIVLTIHDACKFLQDVSLNALEQSEQVIILQEPTA